MRREGLAPRLEQGDWDELSQFLARKLKHLVWATQSFSAGAIYGKY
jgi:hypothetical protein